MHRRTVMDSHEEAVDRWASWATLLVAAVAAILVLLLMRQT